jgi:hypothetical protein
MEALGAVVAVDVETFTLADATVGHAGTTGDGTLVGQQAVGELHHRIVGNDFETGSGH